MPPRAPLLLYCLCSYYSFLTVSSHIPSGIWLFIYKGGSGLCSVPTQSPTEAQCKARVRFGKGGARERKKFSAEGKAGAGNGVERTLLRRHPQSAVSMGIICFFRLITLGQENMIVLGLDVKSLLDDIVAAGVQQMGALQQHIGYHEYHNVEAVLGRREFIVSMNSSGGPAAWRSLCRLSG